MKSTFTSKPDPFEHLSDDDTDPEVDRLMSDLPMSHPDDTTHAPIPQE